MKKFTSIAIIMIATVFLAGCPKKPAIIKEEAMAPAPPAPVKPEVKEMEKAEPQPKPGIEAPTPVKEEKPEELTPAEKLAKLKEQFKIEDIHFDFDRYDLTEKARDILDNIGNWLLKNKEVKIRIEGHTDERGTDEYNLALGDGRANSIKQYLVNLGVSAARISTISYGEEKPFCTESNEDCWYKNRRGHFVIEN